MIKLTDNQIIEGFIEGGITAAAHESDNTLVTVTVSQFTFNVKKRKAKQLKNRIQNMKATMESVDDQAEQDKRSGEITKMATALTNIP